MNFGGRTVAFKSLVGSHNYNLNDENSDKDYKVFVLPTFDDLYFNNTFSKSYIGEDEDYDCHDIRKCSSLWFKANVNFLEVLFSESPEVNASLNNKSKLLIYQLYEIRNDIAKMNLNYLYSACIGMHYTKTKQVTKGTEGTQHLVDKYGYDTKQAMHAWRILDFLQRFADNKFTDLKKAIWYADEETGSRTILFAIKNGKLTLEEYNECAKSKLALIEEKYKSMYTSQVLDEETNNRVLEIIKELVRINII